MDVMGIRVLTTSQEAAFALEYALVFAAHTTLVRPFLLQHSAAGASYPK